MYWNFVAIDSVIKNQLDYKGLYDRRQNSPYIYFSSKFYVTSLCLKKNFPF
jgi:hypothetical protein